jgi:hypothetical protein
MVLLLLRRTGKGGHPARVLRRMYRVGQQRLPKLLHHQAEVRRHLRGTPRSRRTAEAKLRSSLSPDLLSRQPPSQLPTPHPELLSSTKDRPLNPLPPNPPLGTNTRPPTHTRNPNLINRASNPNSNALVPSLPQMTGTRKSTLTIWIVFLPNVNLSAALQQGGNHTSLMTYSR